MSPVRRTDARNLCRMHRPRNGKRDRNKVASGSEHYRKTCPWATIVELWELIYRFGHKRFDCWFGIRAVVIFCLSETAFELVRRFFV